MSASVMNRSSASYTTVFS